MALSEKGKKIASILILLALVLASALVFVFLWKPLTSVVSNPQKFREFIDSFGIWGRLVFVLMVVMQVIIAVIPGEPFEIAAGYIFGSFEGTVLCLLGILIGSIIIFLLVRKFGVKLVEVFFSRDKINSLRFLNTSKKATTLCFIIMFIPGTPKDLLSYFAGLTKITLPSWLFISVFARIPSVLTSSVGGSLLGNEKYLFAIITFGVTLIVSVIGLLIYNRITKEKADS